MTTSKADNQVIPIRIRPTHVRTSYRLQIKEIQPKTPTKRILPTHYVSKADFKNHESWWISAGGTLTDVEIGAMKNGRRNQARMKCGKKNSGC